MPQLTPRFAVIQELFELFEGKKKGGMTGLLLSKACVSNILIFYGKDLPKKCQVGNLLYKLLNAEKGLSRDPLKEWGRNGDQ